MLETANMTDVEAFLPVVQNGGEGLFRPDRARYLVRAPGRLDVMGGIADATGSLVVATSLQAGIALAGQTRDDQSVRLACFDPKNARLCHDLSWPLSRLYGHDGKLVGRSTFMAGLDADRFAPTRCVSALIYALLERSLLENLAGGFSIGAWLGIPAGCGAGGMAALQVATCQCLSVLCGVRFEPADVTAACQHAQHTMLGLPVGPMDPVVALHGQSGSLLQVQCRSAQVAGALHLPDATRLFGIDSGKRHPRAGEKYREAYTAAAMGRRIIQALINRDTAAASRPVGCLADVQPAEFVTRFRDALPTRLRGREYTRQFSDGLGETCPIDPAQVYKVRSRTEHHIYENQRVHDFVSLIGRARHTGQTWHLDQAGQLMYSSHWSYGQRCGLGSIETDLLVNLLREKGVSRGVYGARVSGGGAGGMVTVFCAEGDRARSAVAEALDAYRAKTGIEPTCYEGSSEGALAFHYRRIE